MGPRNHQQTVQRRPADRHDVVVDVLSEKGRWAEGAVIGHQLRDGAGSTFSFQGLLPRGPRPPLVVIHGGQAPDPSGHRLYPFPLEPQTLGTIPRTTAIERYPWNRPCPDVSGPAPLPSE